MAKRPDYYPSKADIIASHEQTGEGAKLLSRRLRPDELPPDREHSWFLYVRDTLSEARRNGRLPPATLGGAETQRAARKGPTEQIQAPPERTLRYDLVEADEEDFYAELIANLGADLDIARASGDLRHIARLNAQIMEARERLERARGPGGPIKVERDVVSIARRLKEMAPTLSRIAGDVIDSGGSDA